MRRRPPQYFLFVWGEYPRAGLDCCKGVFSSIPSAKDHFKNPGAELFNARAIITTVQGRKLVTVRVWDQGAQRWHTIEQEEQWNSKHTRRQR